MSTKVITYQVCDVCHFKVESSDVPEGWVHYDYATTWKSGGHSGRHEKKFLACDDCHDDRPVFEKMFRHFRGINTAQPIK